MSRLPDGRREVMPSRQAAGDRRGPSFGSKLNVSVPISFGLPLMVVGGFVIFTAIRTGARPALDHRWRLPAPRRAAVRLRQAAVGLRSLSASA